MSEEKNVVDRVEEYFHSLEKKVEKRQSERVYSASDMLYVGLIVGCAIGVCLMMFVNSF